MIGVALLMLLASGPFTVVPGGRCTTYEEQSLQRRQTICSDGTRGVSTWNSTLERWDTVVMPPAGTPAGGKKTK